MKMFIIPDGIADKLREMEFDKFNRLMPIAGEMDGKSIFFLPADLKDSPIFASARVYFEECQIKEVTTAMKYFDSNGIELANDQVDISQAVGRHVLTVVKP